MFVDVRKHLIKCGRLIGPPATELSWPDSEDADHVVDTSTPTISNLDGTIVGADPATSPASMTHTYAAQDIYSISVEIHDACGNLATDEIVVEAHDPNDEFTTGGGWFVPDADSFIDGNLVTDTTAKANFGWMGHQGPCVRNPDVHRDDGFLTQGASARALGVSRTSKS